MKLYGVFSKGKFALTYKRKVAIDYVTKNGGEVRSINDDPAYHSFDARTFRLISQLEFDQELAVKKNPPSASYRKSGMNYLPVITDGKKRETLFGSPLATVATAKKYAQIEINERNRKAHKKNPAMNTDELFNRYSEEMQKINPSAVKGLERSMSEMLEMRVTPSVAWNYAKRSIASAKKFAKNTRPRTAATKIKWYKVTGGYEGVAYGLDANGTYKARYDFSIANNNDMVFIPQHGGIKMSAVTSLAKAKKVLNDWFKSTQMKSNPRPRKYVTVIIGQGNYGSGWEDEASYLDDKAGREEAKADRKSYRENSQYPFRNIRRKVKIEDYEKGNF